VVTPMVVIGEAYPGAFYITQGGLPFVVGEVFASDGIYQLEIYATDLAGNQAQQVVQFTIDQQAPAIEISGLVDGAAYNTLVAPVIQISDANLHSQQVRLNGQTYLSATPIAAEGDYVLEAIGIDIAGNTTRVEYRFSIDFSAPSIAISGVADQAHYNRDVIALVDVSDAGQYTASITLNGQAYVPGEPISAPGDYQLVVTASDAAGNAAGATLAFVIDRTAPVIDIGGVVDNGFYKAAAPAISVSETHLDSLGITLDGVDYVSQTPVSAEGGHLLRVAARDRAGNESIREVFFTVDFTAPLVSVDTPLHGETLFTRNTDVVGQTEPFATVHLQLGQARLVTQADVGGLFAFNGVVLEQGANTLLLNATDRAANAGPLTEISVQVVSGDVPGEYRAPGGILIWSAHRQDDCTSVKSKKSVKSTKSVTALKDGKPDCHVHQPGEMLQHAGEPGLALLQQALAAERRDYLLVHNEYDFLRAMRSQRFGTLLLLDWHKDYCGKYDNSCATDGFELDELKVGRDTRDEIRALVASGSGLLWIKTRPEQEDDWTGLAGVRARAALNGVSTIEVLDSPIATAGEFDYAGRAVTLDLDGATALGVAQPRGKTVLSANDYGAGRVVVLAFNPAAAVDAERAARLLAELVAYVTPVTTNLTVNGVAEVDWVIEDVPAATAIELRVNLPAGLRFLHAADATLNESRDEALWQRDYAAADNRFSALVRLAAAAGSYDIDAALAQVDGEQRLVLGTGQLSLAIDDRFAEYRAQLLASVVAIEVAKKGKSSKHDKYAIRKILDLLDEAFAHEPASAALADIESAIDALLEVAYEVEKKALNTRPLTRQLGDVLRVYQSAWYRLVAGGEVGDEL